ncbi:MULTISPECIES: hypothetical protein [Caldimonas]|jgi:hypothetical protein|uniref:hypothetical protein n=1 Tax=Caldimonas TaxID=196013 RepID=UPI0012E9F539|nr:MULTISPECIES: hypothetical protein [Caldimonas]MCX7660854.1 hypothetical protein [Caldimonas manganoxidans]GIX25393.1 MAG: hypothetical protein KatS3mg122_2624 [Caldimonas sp.]
MTSVFSMLDDQEDACGAFHLPVQGLFADLERAQGSVSLDDEFLSMPPEAQAAILQDWQRALEATRRRALIRMFAEISDRLPQAPISVRWQRLRERCERLGLECPAELPVLLGAA